MLNKAWIIPSLFLSTKAEIHLKCFFLRIDPLHLPESFLPLCSNTDLLFFSLSIANIIRVVTYNLTKFIFKLVL